MAEYEEASADQKLNIASYFILSSPVGEVNDVVKDVVALINDTSVLSDEKLTAIMREYNLNNLATAQAPDGSAVLVSPYGEVDAESYLDPATGKVFKFDHKKQAFVGETDQKQVLPDNITNFRTALQNAAKQYLESVYSAGKWAAAVYAADDAQLTICVSAKNVKLSNFWSGGIQSRYTLNVGQNGQTDLTGSLKVNVHYFEDGNVQLNINHEKSARVQVNDAESTAKSVIGAMSKLESDFFSTLEEMYLNMNSDIFKAMRRVLPVTRETMTWTSAAHSLATQMSK